MRSAGSPTPCVASRSTIVPARRACGSAAAALLILLLPCLLLLPHGAAGAQAATDGAPGGPGGAGATPASPTCALVAQQLQQRHGVAFPGGLEPVDGSHYCRGMLATRSSSAPGRWLDWNVTVALHMALAGEGAPEAAILAAKQCAMQPGAPEQQQQQQQQHSVDPSQQQQQQQQQQQPTGVLHPSLKFRQPPSIMALAAEHPSAGGIYISNLLCMPRLTLLWHWLTGEWRSALAAASGVAGPADEGTGAPAADGHHEGWHAVQPELTMLRSVQQLAAALHREPSPTDKGTATGGVTPAGVVRLVSPPFGGSDWTWARFWAGWLAAPGVLVALQVVESAGREPWFVVHVAWLGLLRAAAELHALYMAAFTDLTSTEQLDRLVISHAVPAAVHLVLAALQAMFAPLMPRVLLLALFWLRCLVVPLLNLWAIYSSWLPDYAAQGADRSLDRRRRRRHHHHSRGQLAALAAAAQQPAGAGAGAAGAGADEAAAAAAARQAGLAPGGGGGNWFAAQPGGLWPDRAAAPPAPAPAAAAPSSSSSSRPVHWPPPLPIPRDLDDVPDAPEAFRCPITLALMREPTQATSGITYERTAIMQWLEGSRFDPVTHAPLRRRHLSPNLTLRVLMEPWIRDKTAELAKEAADARTRAGGAASSASSASSAEAERDAEGEGPCGDDGPSSGGGGGAAAGAGGSGGGGHPAGQAQGWGAEPRQGQQWQQQQQRQEEVAGGGSGDQRQQGQSPAAGLEGPAEAAAPSQDAGPTTL